MGGNLIKGVVREDLWRVEVVGGGMSQRAAAANAQRVKATGPPQVGRHDCPWLYGSLEEGEG
jgi:xanthine/CO dehydrogenase XdhC/CoxF family maturation factor